MYCNRCCHSAAAVVCCGIVADAALAVAGPRLWFTLVNGAVLLLILARLSPWLPHLGCYCWYLLVVLVSVMEVCVWEVITFPGVISLRDAACVASHQSVFVVIPESSIPHAPSFPPHHCCVGTRQRPCGMMTARCRLRGSFIPHTSPTLPTLVLSSISTFTLIKVPHLYPHCGSTVPQRGCIVHR